jgi:dynein heavy chain, axonemal
MHENANISYQLQETRRLIRTVLEVQPRVVSGGAGSSNEEIVSELCSSILLGWPSQIILEVPTERPRSGGREEADSESKSILAKLFEKDENGRMLNSLSTVLLQEAARFNRLNEVVKNSLENVTKAVKGLIVMNAELELVFKSLLNNEV